MRRVFAIEVLICERCQGPTRIIADIHSPNAIRAILECLGLPARAPPVASARCEDPQDGLPGVGPNGDPDLDRAITDVGEE